MSESERPSCAYCAAVQAPEDDLHLLETLHWRVVHGPPETTGTGGVKVISRRHFVDFADMDQDEQGSFGPLVHDLDAAIQEVTGAERVHLVSTRDRVPHFHAWLYPRYSTDALRGTAFLDAPQTSARESAVETSARLRSALRHLADRGGRVDL